MPTIKKEPQNDAAQDKYDLYKSQERLRALLNKKQWVSKWVSQNWQCLYSKKSFWRMGYSYRERS
mgnify:CR=1 FL=1